MQGSGLNLFQMHFIHRMRLGWYRARRPDVVMYGQPFGQIWVEGRLRSVLGAQAKALGTADHVDFRGHVSDTATVHAEAEVVVLSSLWEGLPNVIIEALAQATPVVATHTPGAVEILQGGDCGLLSKLGDPDELAAKLVQALSQQWDRVALIARARDYYDDRLNQRVVALSAHFSSHVEDMNP